METKKRRGGKRIRRLKERFEETDLMKQANRRGFASEVGEYGDDAMGLTLGMLDSKQGTGNARSILDVAEKRKIRQANTKASRKRAMQASWNATRQGTVSGMASSLTFTPVQGLELVNPDANKQRVRDANRKWFEDNAGFQSALPK
jgi:U4/U6 small nuclear ribonucleoprotein PRP31